MSIYCRIQGAEERELGNKLQLESHLKSPDLQQAACWDTLPTKVKHILTFYYLCNILKKNL